MAILLTRYAPNNAEVLFVGAVLPALVVSALRTTPIRFVLTTATATLVSIGWLWDQRLALASGHEASLKSSIFVVAGAVLLWLASRRAIAAVALGAPQWLLLGAALVGFAAPLVVRYATHDAYIGLRLPGVTVQPAEAARVLIVLWLAAQIGGQRHLLRNGVVASPEQRAISPAGVALRMATPALVGVGLGVVSNDYGPAFLLATVCLVMLMVAGLQRRYLLAATAVALVSINAAQFLSAKVQARFTQLDSPLEQTEGLSQLGLGLAALSRGGWMGLGIGQGVPAMVPRAGDDMLFVALGEEVGGLAMICCLLLITLMLLSSIRLAKTSGVGAPHLAIVGLASLQLIQSAWAVGGNLAVVPLTGIPVPLLAVSGSSLLMSMLSVGLRIGLAGAHEADDTAPAITQRLRTLAMVGTIIMTVLGSSMIRWELVRAATLDTTNDARDTLLKATYRGSMVTRDGVTVAATAAHDAPNRPVRPENAARLYPAGPSYGPVVGIASRTGYLTGLEAGLNNALQCRNADRFDLNSCPTVTLTLDSRIQKAAYDAMESRTGALIVTDVASGDILAYISRDTATTNGAEAVHDYARVDTAMPGSVAKLVTAAGALQAELPAPAPVATINLGGQTFTGPRGTVCGASLEKAIAESCNPYFAQLGNSLGNARLTSSADQLLNSQTAVAGMPVTKSLLTTPNADTAMTARGAIGLGNAQVTPLAMTMLTTTIARGGDATCLHLTTAGQDDDCSAGSMPAPVAMRLQKGMSSVVTTGTAKAISALEGAAGKTGTADRGNGKQNAWFVGYYPAEEPELSISVMLLPTEIDPLPQGAHDAGTIAGNVLRSTVQVRG
ncbi:FtsW/RodA/SpoVE family cell cycle protein [Propioniciclava sinopodophylli]|uniref:FtsW/RodA/SpoVE family cell cycle protein n=1 Tax=Propioniciclava sinopodophylli TaxID=1837344 RepID=UPI002491DD5F|nr:FtsW/RodA/SpoVE family cell cycle protein [Propioniciclava sinopodophylli]